MKKLVAVLITCLLLTGCSTIKSGTIYDKSYTSSHTEVHAQPAYVNGSVAVIPMTVISW